MSCVVYFLIVLYAGVQMHSTDIDKIDTIIIRRASQVLDRGQRSVSSVYNLRTKLSKVLSDAIYPLHQELVGRKIQRSDSMKTPATGTERYRRSFVPRAIEHFSDLYRRQSPLEIESL